MNQPRINRNTQPCWATLIDAAIDRHDDRAEVTADAINATCKVAPGSPVTLPLELPLLVATRLQAEARRMGCNVEHYVRELLFQVVAGGRV